jgi:hypothetical protein
VPTTSRRLSVAGIALALVASSLFVSGFYGPRRELAGAATFLPCKLSQITIHVAAIVKSPLVGGTSFVLSFTNTGRPCILDSDAPGVQAVSGRSHRPVGMGTPNDLLMSLPPRLKDGQHSRSILTVASTSGSTSAQCKPVTTTGLLVNYAFPVQSTAYVPLVLHHVCSSKLVGNLVSGDYGVTTG